MPPHPASPANKRTKQTNESVDLSTPMSEGKEEALNAKHNSKSWGRLGCSRPKAGEEMLEGEGMKLEKRMQKELEAAKEAGGDVDRLVMQRLLAGVRDSGPNTAYKALASIEVLLPCIICVCRCRRLVVSLVGMMDLAQQKSHREKTCFFFILPCTFSSVSLLCPSLISLSLSLPFCVPLCNLRVCDLLLYTYVASTIPPHRTRESSKTSQPPAPSAGARAFFRPSLQLSSFLDNLSNGTRFAQHLENLGIDVNRVSRSLAGLTAGEMMEGVRDTAGKVGGQARRLRTEAVRMQRVRGWRLGLGGGGESCGGGTGGA